MNDGMNIMAKFSPKEVLEEYKNNISAYKVFEKILVNLIENILFDAVKNNELDSNCYEIKSRTKTLESLEGKIKRDDKIFVYKDPLREITDLVGIKLMLISLNDEDVVYKLLNKELSFYIDHENSVNKIKELYEQRKFGYLGRHIIVWYNDQMLKYANVDLKKEAKKYNLQNFRAEIQVKTLLQHVWSEIEHKVRYKAKEYVSTERKRAFDRLAALTELTDSLFKDMLKREEQLADQIINAIVNEISIDIKNKTDIIKNNVKTSDASNCDIKLKNIEISSEAIKIFIGNEIIKNKFKNLQTQDLIITYEEEPASVNLRFIDALKVIGIYDFDSLSKMLENQNAINILHKYAKIESSKIEYKIMLQKLTVLQILVYAQANLEQREELKQKRLIYNNICESIDELDGENNGQKK